MSMYGYSDALSQGSAFNSRVKTFNEGVLLHNQREQDRYDREVKEQVGKESDDNIKQKEDEAFYGFKDGTGAIGSIVATGTGIRDIYKKGFKGYAVDEIKNRANNVKSTAKAIVYGEPKPKPTPQTVPTEVNAEGNVQEALSDPASAGLSESQAAFLQESKAAMEGKTLAGAGEQAAELTERESSGLLSGAIKKGLQLTTMGKVGDAGLSAASEIGGKVIGDFSGGVDIAKSVDNLINKKSFFSGETTADKFQEVGAMADIVGLAFPPAEILGGALNLTGGIIDAVNDIGSDLDKKNKDAAAPDPPKITAVKVSPAFQSMGLIASTVPSAKNQIVGAGSF